MNAVTPIDATVKPTIENACHWLQQKGERGELPMSTARFKVTAIRQLVGVLAEEEPGFIAARPTAHMLAKRHEAW